MIQGPLKTEKEYRAMEIDSSSSLKVFSTDRRKYYKKYILKETAEDEEDSKAAIVGRLVETQLFEPDEFDNRFYMSSLSHLPTGNMLAFAEALYKHTKEATNEDGEINKEFSELCSLAYKDSGFKWKLETVLEKFTGSDAELYYKELREVRGKNLTVVTLDDITNADKIIEELKTSETTAPIINLKNSDRYSVYNQLQVSDFTILDLPMKAMMDKVIIDHTEKTIQVDDLKCVWSVENFFEDYYLYRRAYIQAYVYKEACYAIKEQYDLENYIVLNPRFIVCDSVNYYRPLVYVTTNHDMNEAWGGFEYKGRKYPGVKEIVEDIIWAKENNEWRISKRNYLNGGVIGLKS